MKTYKKTKKNPLNAKRKTKKYGGGSRAAFADSSLPTTPIVKSLQPLQKAGYHHCLKLTSVINPRLPKQFTDCVFTLKAVQKGDILKIWNILPSNQKSFYSGHISVEIERGNRSYSFGFCGKGDQWKATSLLRMGAFLAIFAILFSPMALISKVFASLGLHFFRNVYEGQIISPDCFLNSVMHGFRKYGSEQGKQPTLISILRLDTSHEDLIERLNTMLFSGKGNGNGNSVPIDPMDNPKEFSNQEVRVIFKGMFEMRNMYGDNCTSFIQKLLSDKIISCKFLKFLHIPSQCVSKHSIDRELEEAELCIDSSIRFLKKKKLDKVIDDLEQEYKIDARTKKEVLRKRINSILWTSNAKIKKFVFVNVNDASLSVIMEELLSPQPNPYIGGTSLKVKLSGKCENEATLISFIRDLRLSLNITDIDFTDFPLSNRMVYLLIATLLEKQFFSSKNQDMDSDYQKTRKVANVHVLTTNIHSSFDTNGLWTPFFPENANSTIIHCDGKVDRMGSVLERYIDIDTIRKFIVPDSTEIINIKELYENISTHLCKAL